MVDGVFGRHGDGYVFPDFAPAPPVKYRLWVFFLGFLRGAEWDQLTFFGSISTTGYAFPLWCYYDGRHDHVNSGGVANLWNDYHVLDVFSGGE